jgi:hypothetical protein
MSWKTFQLSSGVHATQSKAAKYSFYRPALAKSATGAERGSYAVKKRDTFSMILPRFIVKG